MSKSPMQPPANWSESVATSSPMLVGAELAQGRGDRFDLADHLQQDQTRHRAKIGMIVVAPLAQGSGVAMDNPQADRPTNRTGKDSAPDPTCRPRS